MTKHRRTPITNDTLVARLKRAESIMSEFITDPSFELTITPEGLTALNKYPETLSTLQMHVLIVTTTTRTFFDLCTIIPTNIPAYASFTPTMFADAVTRLIQRGFLSKAILPIRRTSVHIDGTLTINQDGTISFVPSDPRFSVISGTSSWLLITTKPNPPTTRPIHIDATHSAVKVNY